MSNLPQKLISEIIKDDKSYHLLHVPFSSRKEEEKGGFEFSSQIQGK